MTFQTFENVLDRARAAYAAGYRDGKSEDGSNRGYSARMARMDKGEKASYGLGFREGARWRRVGWKGNGALSQGPVAHSARCTPGRPGDRVT